MKKLLFVLSSCLLFAPNSSASVISYVVVLDGASQSPPNASLGTGSATVIYDDVLHTLDLDVSFSGLIGNTTAAHIHCCTASPLTGTVGVATTTPTFVGFPLGVTAGSYSYELDLKFAPAYNPTFLNSAVNQGSTANAEYTLAAGIAGGQAYLNIHSTAFPGGEIRGFLVPAPVPVPEPSSFLLAGPALLAMLLRRRR